MANVEQGRFRQSAFNSSMIPSPADLLLALPRLVSYTFSYLPEQLDDLFAIAKSPGRLIADATSNAAASNATMITSGTPFAQSPGSAAAKASLTGGGEGFFSFARNISLYQSISNLDGVFSYIGSRWAVSTFLIAIILNRAHVYASSRRRLRLNWESRLIMRIIPILLFIYQVETILQAIRCQTGPLLPEAQTTDAATLLNGSFTNEGGPLHYLSSILLFWQSETDSCHAAGMLVPENPADAIGSSTVLWPLFLSLCVSHFIETVSCALQGRQPMAETGMTIFEHSLAFAEAEAVVRSSVGMGVFSLPNENQIPVNTMTKLMSLTRPVVMQKLNVPPEVLLIALISSTSHLTSHTLAVFRVQSRWRLVNTFIWGTCFMGAFLWSFIRFSHFDANPKLAVIRYPTVCIIGFIPHFMVLVGILVCGAIYVISLTFTLLSPPTAQHSEGTFWDKLKMARNNLQASAALSNIHVSWRDEFYTTLMKVGFSVLTAASEAVYFNEGTQVTVATQTWLEGQRYSEAVAEARLAKERQKKVNFVPPEIQGSVVAEGLSMVDDPLGSQGTRVSGFGRERKAGKAGLRLRTAATREEGVGRSQHHGRVHLSLLLIWESLKLVVRCQAKLFVVILRIAGVDWTPNWLLSLARPDTQPQKEPTSSSNKREPTTLEFWMLSDDGTLHLPSGTSVDVELETRKRLAMSEGEANDEEHIDQKLYRWWQSGGFWGELDGSGDYAPSTLDDNEDTTSVVSTAFESDTESEFDRHNSDGRRTPTQQDYRGESPPFADETIQQLSRLLDPKTLEDRQEAHLLARHLQRPGPVTRSQYRRLETAERLRFLQPTSNPHDQSSASPLTTPEEEEQLLEQLIRSRRHPHFSTITPAASDPATPTNVNTSTSAQPQETSKQQAASTSWTQGAEGMGAEGPQCVVCRSAPRTILVWPCRCLSLCEECRVSLAVNNFASCVCCRREVVAFSRLFVP